VTVKPRQPEQREDVSLSHNIYFGNFFTIIPCVDPDDGRLSRCVDLDNRRLSRCVDLDDGRLSHCVDLDDRG